jgi:hypothetical protein
MIRFEVIELDEGWGVFAVDLDNPDDKELATVCMERGYAEMRAAALNQVGNREPATQPAAPRCDVEVDDKKRIIPEVIRGIEFED